MPHRVGLEKAVLVHFLAQRAVQCGQEGDVATAASSHTANQRRLLLVLHLQSLWWPQQRQYQQQYQQQ
jgi:hypothetical protein